MNAASPGGIVRVVGNNLGDGNLTNDIPYEIGFPNQDGAPALPDGGADGILRVKKGVVLMIDAGAVVKLRRGTIVVGSSSSTVDNSGASIQLLGTPQDSVHLTSLNDESIGRDNNPLPTTPSRGDWGGIQLRNDFDNATNKFNYEDQGILPRLHQPRRYPLRWRIGVFEFRVADGQRDYDGRRATHD